MLRVIKRAGASALQRVRHHFGLSQADVAPFLGISPVQVAQTESGARPLPLKAVLPQGQLSAAQHAEPAAVPDAPDLAALLARARQCRHEAAQARFRLAGLQERAAVAHHRLAALPALRQIPLGGPPWLPQQVLWLQLFEGEARLELGASGATVQTLLTARIAALEHEAEALERVLG